MLVIAGLICLAITGAIIAYLIKSPTLSKEGFEA